MLVLFVATRKRALRLGRRLELQVRQEVAATSVLVQWCWRAAEVGHVRRNATALLRHVEPVDEAVA